MADFRCARRFSGEPELLHFIRHRLTAPVFCSSIPQLQLDRDLHLPREQQRPANQPLGGTLSLSLSLTFTLPNEYCHCSIVTIHSAIENHLVACACATARELSNNPYHTAGASPTDVDATARPKPNPSLARHRQQP
jgi:hypothetical protein